MSVRDDRFAPSGAAGGRLISGHAEIGTLPVFFGVLGGFAAF